MYAVVGTWSMEAGRWEEQVKGLHENIVPLTRQLPGFVSGTWLGDATTGKTTSMIVLEDEEAARNFKAFVEGNPSQSGASWRHDGNAHDCRMYRRSTSMIRNAAI